MVQRYGHTSNGKSLLRRSALFAALLSLSGCATGSGGLASLNPFSKASPAGAAAEHAGPAEPGVVSRFAQGTRAQANSLSLAVKSGAVKTRDGVVGIFGGKKTSVVSGETGEQVAANDPLRLDNTPDSAAAEVLVANGQMWEASGNHARALENYSRALESEPENGPALASIARLHYRQQQYEQAAAYFQRAIQKLPKEAALHNDAGLNYSRLGKHAEATQMLQQAMALEPATTRYANNLATVYFESGNEAAAREILMKNNSPAVAHYNMAFLQYSANRTDKAMSELGQVLALESTSPQDASSKLAISKAKDLSARLSGQAMQVASAAPAAIDAIRQTGQSIGTLARDAGSAVSQATGTGQYRAQLSDNPAGTTSPAGTSTPVVAAGLPSSQRTGDAATTPGTTMAPVAVQPAGVIQPTGVVQPNGVPGKGEFSMPPLMAEQPGTTQKR